MGEVFAGRYELVDPIGRGGVGAVWRAWDQRRRRYVAAKVLQQSDAHALLRFVREQALRIDHPHVLAPASWAADDDKVLFTMDLVLGGSLSLLVGDQGALPPRQVCVLLDQLLAGLGAVHAEGVVHRDIKPANVLLEATGTGTPHVRLSDFGIAMRKGDPRLTEADYVVGTPGYFAPEQLLGAEPDFPADLYAVGLVALYLLSGYKPDAQALQERFAGGMPPAPLGVPDPLWQVVGALLQPDPYARFRTATGARKALAAALELLPEDGDEPPIEVIDRIGPLPEGFGPDGPLSTRAGRHALGAPTVTGERHGQPGAIPARPLTEPSVGAPVGPPPGRTPMPVPAPPTTPPPHLPPPVPPFAPATGQPAVQPTAQPAVEPAAPHTAQPGPPPAVPPGAHQAAHPATPSGPRPGTDPSGSLQVSDPLTHTRTRMDGPAPLPPPRPATAPSTSATPAASPMSATPTRTAAAASSEPASPAQAGSPQAAGPAQGDTASAQLPASRRRLGPPPKVALSVLLLALLCFAVGIAALAAA